MRIRTIAAAAVAPLALGSLLLTTAGAASAGTSAGTTGPGSWQFLTWDSAGNMTDGIQLAKTSQSSSTTYVTTTGYQAKVQPPINAPGQIPSVFSNKSRTIPVKYTVQKQDVRTPTTVTTTTTTDAVYPDTLKSDGGTAATNLNWSPPAGDNLKVSDIASLVAYYSWKTGSDHGGSMRWQIDTPDGPLYVYYGDPASFTSEAGNNTLGSYTGDNMVAPWGGGRAEFQGSSPQYDTWANIKARPAPSGSAVATIGDEPVSDIGLVVDAGWGGDQAVTVTQVNLQVGADNAIYMPGTVPGGTSVKTTTGAPQAGPWTTLDPNSQAAYLYLAKVSSDASVSPINEATITSTQGDTGGRFRVADGMYIYNLPVSQLTDLTATYQVGISFNPDGSNPLPTPVQFGLR